MDQTGEKIFLVVLLACMLLFGTLLFIGLPKEQRAKQKNMHDERQRIEQGRAFQYAYITLIYYLIAYESLNQIFGIVWCDNAFGLLLGIALSVSVLMAYCIFQDACFGINDNNVGAMIGVNVIGLAQLFLGIEHIVAGDIIENGIITENAMNLLFFAVILLLDIFVFIRKRLDKQAS